MNRKIYLGSDHGGFELKEKLVGYLISQGYDVVDLGTRSTDSVNYPEFGRKVAEHVLKDGCMGVIVCGTGLGISIAANRIKGIRAALCHSVEYAKLAREHNNANILALGGRFTEDILAFDILDTFLETNFEGGRHQARVDDIDNV
ncbi:MAG: ribose 5-phosphate isomerase B [Candidatus Cloacimonadota bacterium]|nr:MAG: ribose 5-phosphate isomerase B [Candidatus Cloacimonadota bacterium]PIE79325.1 MAG: ribose 5-phosphate isomerase B [Candidatus Delongbacteria bacterium]